MLHLITTERKVQLRGGTPASTCAYAQRPQRQRLSSNGVIGEVDFARTERRYLCRVEDGREH